MDFAPIVKRSTKKFTVSLMVVAIGEIDIISINRNTGYSRNNGSDSTLRDI